MVLYLQIAAAIFSIIGVLLLAREVLTAQKAEQLSAELDQLEAMHALYDEGRMREFYVANLVYGDWPRAKAVQFVEDLGEEAVRKGVAEIGYDALRAQSQAASDRFRSQTLPAVYAKRRRLVWLGAASLILSAILAIAAALIPPGC